jgi:hypothetical protein
MRFRSVTFGRTDQPEFNGCGTALDNIKEAMTRTARFVARLK